MMNKPEVHFQSRHESGNIYATLSLVQWALRKQHRITDYNNLRDRVLNEAQSYDEALSIIREVVDLIDDDGIYNVDRNKSIV